MATGTNNIASVYDLWSTLDTLGDLSSTKTALTSVYGTYSSTAAPETKNQWGTGLCPSKASWLKLNDYNTNGIIEISGTYTNDQLVKYTDLIYKYLKLSVNIWNPSSSAETKTISVTCSGSFTVSSNRSWLTVSSTSGSGSKNITLSVTENTSIENSRLGVVTFVGDGITKEINVRQDARDAVIAYELEISGETSVLVNKTIQLTATLYKKVDGVRTESTNVTNDCNWTVSSLSNYASVNNVSNKGLVTGLKNTYSSQATIKATYSSYSATYKVSVVDDISYEFVITSDVDEIQVGDFVTFTATLYTNTNGTVSESSKTASSTWSENSNNTIVEKYSMGSFKGISAGTVIITATWTNFNGVVFSDSKSITVNASDSIVISPKTWTVPVGGESKVITITANNNWTVNNIPDWITIDTTSGIGNGSVTLSANANDSTSLRSETINFVCGNSSATLSVSQSGKAADSISVTPTSWTPGSSVNSTYVSLTSSGAWTASSNRSWLTVGTTSGTSTTSKSIKLSVTENTTTSERIGTVKFTCGTATAMVHVKQAGKTIESVVTYEIDLRFKDGYESSVYISKYTYFDVYLYTITDGVKDNGVKLNTLVLQNDVTWTVSDTNIVKPLDNYPYAYGGLEPGTTTITASYTYNNQTLTSSEIVTVLPSFINTNLSSYTFNTAGGTKDVIVTCSPNITFLSVSEVDVNGNSNSVSWLSNTKTTNADGSFTYTLTCAENTSANDRTVYVKFYSSSYDKPYKTVKITQSGRELILTMLISNLQSIVQDQWGTSGLDEDLFLTDIGGRAINVGLIYDLYYFDGDYKNSISGSVSSWQKLQQENYGNVYLGTGYGNVSDNFTNVNTWSDSIWEAINDGITELNDSGKDVSFYIEWPIVSTPTISVSKNTWYPSSVASTTTVTITTENVSGYTVTSSETWLTYTKNGDTLTLNVTDHLAKDQRQGMITITSSDSQVTATIRVVQSGPYYIWVDERGDITQDSHVNALPCDVTVTVIWEVSIEADRDHDGNTDEQWQEQGSNENTLKAGWTNIALTPVNDKYFGNNVDIWVMSPVVTGPRRYTFEYAGDWYVIEWSL